MTSTGTSPRYTDLRIISRPGHPDFLDLPWNQPLDEWSDERIVQVTAGIHRHIVRFVDHDGVLYALKELPGHLADREYRLLRRMAEESLPVVEAAGVARRAALDDVVITRYLDFSLPYRILFTHRRPIGDSTTNSVQGLHERLLNALAVLLVRMHLKGFYWGDCSLSNTLFRRDAGGLAAYIVDVETGEWHPQLTDGQREMDLEVTKLNVAGGLMDLQAQLDLPPDPDPVDTAEGVYRRYQQLWEELNTDVIIGSGERYLIEARIRRLNELGFDVEEVELESTARGDRLRVHTSVAEQGHHRRRLLQLTGLHAQENQARSVLNDLANFRAAQERDSGRSIPEVVATYRWLSEVYEKVVRAIPPEHQGKLEPVELFHEVIEHKWYLSEQEGHDVGIERALASYLQTVLPVTPVEQRVLTDDPREGWIGFG